MASVKERYGVVSEIDSVGKLRLAMAKFEKQGVRKIISLGVEEKGLESVKNSYEFLKSSNLKNGKIPEFYFLGLGGDARYVLADFKRDCRGLHSTDGLEHRLKNGCYEIVFFDRNNINDVMNNGVSYTLSGLNLEFPERTIVMSGESLVWMRDKNGRFVAKALREDKGITKFVSSSRGEPLGNNIMPDCASHRLVWDVGKLSRGNCGILSVYNDGKVSYNNIRLDQFNSFLY